MTRAFSPAVLHFAGLGPQTSAEQHSCKDLWASLSVPAQPASPVLSEFILTDLVEVSLKVVLVFVSFIN